jgi:transaldolase
MGESRAKRVNDFGQSFWYDNISRPILREGLLARLVAQDGIAGVTSNPTIFMKAIAEGSAYDGDIRRLAREGKTAREIVHDLMVGDIREAADILRGVWDASGGADGYVSLECDPHLAHDAKATIAEGELLAREVGRPNLMIKVPGTPQGLPAVRELLARGINVNITLLFAPENYRQVALAYLEALEIRSRASLPLAGLHSVASFFLSRIDTAVDARLKALAVAAGGSEGERIGRLRGETAIAVAKVTYAIFGELFTSGSFRALAGRGGSIQRPLWASTGTKDPSYSDVRYVETLIGPHTVNTLPQATLDAFRDHGRAAETITAGLEDARRLLAQVEALGIRLEDVCGALQRDGVQSFIDSFDALVSAVQQKMA